MDVENDSSGVKMKAKHRHQRLDVIVYLRALDYCLECVEYVLLDLLFYVSTGLYLIKAMRPRA
jgi:hypothetical protein